MSCPGDLSVVEGQDFDIISTASGMGSTPVEYVWQVSKDAGVTWSNTADESESELIITGIGYGKTNTSYDGYPKFIELYALEDVNLQNYRMKSHISSGTGYNWNWVMYQVNKSLKKGDYILIYYQNNDANTFFGDDIDNIYDYTIYEDGFYYTMRDGNDNFTLQRINSSGSFVSVDRIGDGYNVLSYDDGWLYRKSNSNPTATYDESQWTNCVDCLESATNAAASTPFPLKSYTGTKIGYSDTKGDTLSVSGSPLEMSGYIYRVIGTTPSYVCGANDTSCVVNVTILPDFDKDGIPDVSDDDDDNDGILDTDEGTEDTDGDGLTNQFDLDSDGDGCNDVIEAGFTDSDADGIVGSSPVTVDAQGKVTGVTAFTTPADNDSNGTKDFVEEGSGITITSYLNYFLSETGDTATYIVNFDALGTNDQHKMQWQLSTDNGSTWSDLSESTTCCLLYTSDAADE